MVKRLIINADDFGLCSGANRAIIEAHIRGVVTSASLMVNMEGFDEAVDLARLNPNLDPGIHLTLADGRPLSPPDEVRSLVDKQGYFLRRRRLLALLLKGEVQRSHIKREIRAQVEKFLDTGLKASHIDGDQHVHVFPEIRSIVLEIAKVLGIAVRIPAERIFWRGLWVKGAFLAPFNLVVKIVLRILSQSLRRACQTQQIPTNDDFISVFGILPRRTPCPDDLLKLVGSVRRGVTELMVHPAFMDEGLIRFWGGRKDWALDRKGELDALLSTDFINGIRRNGIQLTSYSAILSG